MDDCLDWGEIEGSSLTHPDMPLPGIRTACHFLIGKMRGQVQIDMAVGMENKLDGDLLKACLASVFTKRGTEMISEFVLNDKALSKLQSYWETYIAKAKLKASPKKIESIISEINAKLKETLR